MTSARLDLRYTQNFLTNGHLVDRLLDRASISAGDLVLEIGPGAGIITERLARRGARVLAVEQDAGLAARLHHRFAGSATVCIRTGDILVQRLPAQPYKVFANIPFNITTAIVSKLTTGTSPPADCYLVVQREAAERIIGRPTETLFALLLKPWFQPSVVHAFRRTDFRPAPAVDVVMLRLHHRARPLIADDETRPYRDFVTAVFTAWQPSAGAALTKLLGRGVAARIAAQAGLNPATRPSHLAFDTWIEVFRAVHAAHAHRLHRSTAGAEPSLRHQQARLHKPHRTRSPRARNRP